MAKSPRPRTRTAARPAARIDPAAAPTPRTPRLPAQLTRAVGAAGGRKATGIIVLDLRKTGAFTDFFLICTGANPRQVQAIADAVEETLKAVKVRPAHVEGYQRAEWVLLDYFDFIVHIFSPAARQFYGLERLWGEATRIEIADDEAGAPARA